MSKSDRSLIRSSRKSELPAFRPLDVDVEGIDFYRDPNQDFVFRTYSDEYVPSQDAVESKSQIGFPSNLEKSSERIVKKGASTFIDVFISFDGAPGAEYHEFRVAKIPIVAEEDGE